jgi:hypothetical protein
MQNCVHIWGKNEERIKNKGKAITVTGCGDPQGCETPTLPHVLVNWLRGGEILSHMHWPPLPQEDSWYLFPIETESTPGPWWGWKDYVNWKLQWLHCKLNACSVVPQATMLPHAPHIWGTDTYSDTQVLHYGHVILGFWFVWRNTRNSRFSWHLMWYAWKMSCLLSNTDQKSLKIYCVLILYAIFLCME